MGLLGVVNTEPDMEVVGEAADGMQAVELFRKLNPDLVLMDLRMPKLDGLEAMRRRRGRENPRDLCSGPGKLTQALGIRLEHNRLSLTEPPFEIGMPDSNGAGIEVSAGPRIGISRATELPWRFCASESPFLSRPVG